jgi:hypothetical protein
MSKQVLNMVIHLSYTDFRVVFPFVGYKKYESYFMLVKHSLFVLR